MNKVSLRFVIILLFSVLLFFVVMSMFFIQLKHSDIISKKAVKSSFNALSKQLENKISYLNEDNIKNVKIITTMLQNVDAKKFFENEDMYIKIFSKILENKEDIYSVYWGDEVGNFFELIHLKSRLHLFKQYNVTQNDEWLVVKIKSNSSQKDVYTYDKNLNLSRHQFILSNYTPVDRRWFKEAMKDKNNVIKLALHKLNSINSFSFTYSKNFNKNMVFSISTLTHSIKLMLQKSEYLSYFLDEDMNIIASSSKKGSLHIAKMMLEDQNNEQIISINNKKYIYNITKIDNNTLILFTNYDNLKAPYEKEFNKVIIFTIIIIVVCMLLISYFVFLIIKPIYMILEQNKKIQKLDFTQIKKIQSPIIEISQLSDSIVNMAYSIQTHNQTLEKRVLLRTKELQKLSNTDKLTNICNRLKLDNELSKLITNSNLHGKKFGIILADIDHFKLVNDNYGHQIGDEILKEFVKVLQSNIRSSDIIGRWGGEEFLIICVDMNLENMVQIAQKLRLNVSEHSFKVVKKLTASFGLSMHAKNETKEHLINRADLALYEAKRLGRNLVKFSV